jgi:flagellar motility protein MotE (MotC chaperone)
MTPDGAAKIFAEMDEESVGKILLQMKETDAALILESLSRQGGASAKRAADLSERLRVAARGNSPKAK